VLPAHQGIGGSALVAGVENDYFTETCSGPEAGSYLTLIDFVYHSTLDLRVIKKRRVGSTCGRLWLSRWLAHPVHLRKTTPEATQGQISSQSPTDATCSR